MLAVVLVHRVVYLYRSVYDGARVHDNERLRWQFRGALAFQHQHKGRRVAAHAVRRAAKQLLHVIDAASCRGFKKEQAAAISSAASNRHFDRTWLIGRGCGDGGGGGWLHSSSLISKLASATDRTD